MLKPASAQQQQKSKTSQSSTLKAQKPATPKTRPQEQSGQSSMSKQFFQEPWGNCGSNHKGQQCSFPHKVRKETLIVYNQAASWVDRKCGATNIGWLRWSVKVSNGSGSSSHLEDMLSLGILEPMTSRVFLSCPFDITKHDSSVPHLVIHISILNRFIETFQFWMLTVSQVPLALRSGS